MINSSYVQCTASHLACFAVLSDASGTSDRETTVRLKSFCVRTCSNAYRWMMMVKMIQLFSTLAVEY